MFFLTASLAQFELSHRQITVKNGLPSNTIFDIKQGIDGSMLIGHNAGLTRYNGFEFQNYINPLKNTALSNIVEVYPQVYLSRNFNDEVFFTKGNELIKIESLSTKKPGFSTYFWLDNSFFCKKANTISQISFTKEILNKTIYEQNEELIIYSICTANNLIYATHSDQVLCIDPKNPTAYSSINVGNYDQKLLFEKEGKTFMYISETGKVYQLSQTGIQDSISIAQIRSGIKVNLIQTLKNGQVVVGTFAGLFLYNKDFQFIGHYFKDSQVASVFEDIENNLWIGTLQDGIFVVPSLNIKTINSTSIFHEKSNFYSNLVVNDSILVLGSFNGKLAKLNHNGELLQTLDLKQVAEIQAMSYNSEKNELLAYCTKLFTIDFKTFKIKRTEDCQSTKSILQINDHIYCGTSNGLKVITSTDQKYYNPELWIKKLTDFNGDLLLETSSGLRMFDQESKEISIYKPLSSFGDYAQLNNITVLGKTLYFTQGAVVYSLSNGQTEKVFEIPGSSISSLEIIDSKIYISSGTEVYVFSEQKLERIDKFKGLQITEIKALNKLDNKLLVVNGTDIQYFENYLSENRVKPSLFLTSVTGTFRQKSDFWESDYESNELNLEFEVLPNISALGSTQIEFDLTGEINQTGRIDLLKDKSLHFERLPAGSYKLELNALNEDELKSDVLTINLVVLKPFYFTWWFVSLIVLGLILIVYLLIKWRIQILSKKNIEKIQKERLKIKALNAELNAIRAQMNPHFIFNCLSSIQAKILDDDSKNAYENLTVFTKLLREALLFTSKEFISLDEEISFIKKYVHLEQMRREGAFEFKLVIEEQLDLKHIKFPSLITQPIIENAILHGLMHQEGPNLLTFSVKTKVDSDALTVEIEDNGIGIVQSKEKNLLNRKNHISFGSQALKERVELLQKRNYLIDLKTIELPKGTKVIICIPHQRYENSFT